MPIYLISQRTYLLHPYKQNILGEFSREQEAFIKGQSGGVDNALPPWVGHQNEDKVKEEIVGLSSVSWIWFRKIHGKDKYIFCFRNLIDHYQSSRQNTKSIVNFLLTCCSQDRRNFVRAPPSGVDFDFNYDISYPIAVAIMTEDTELEKMRFELVPKIITEENFWRNYFYRVSLICQAGDLGTLGGQESDENEGEWFFSSYQSLLGWNAPFRTV